MSIHVDVCEPQWAKQGLECPFGSAAGLMGAQFTWPMDPTFLDGVAAFYSGPVFLCAMYGPAALVILTCFGMASWTLFIVPVISVFSNNIFKRLFLHARPVGSCLISCGMPSGHSQLTIMLAVFILLEVCTRRQLGRIVSGVVVAAVIVLLLPVPWSRVQLRDHSVGQVLIGSSVGCLEAGLWYLLVRFVLCKFFPVLESWTLVLRDNYNQPDSDATVGESERLVKSESGVASSS
mmetsp:Transcript_17661/g.40912  ORF Transcript_17661/g.40912 Transcript_17661/m.40912 type:complete len:235 (-) Transcript_17661:77-781(-)